MQNIIKILKFYALYIFIILYILSLLNKQQIIFNISSKCITWSFEI